MANTDNNAGLPQVPELSGKEFYIAKHNSDVQAAKVVGQLYLELLENKAVSADVRKPVREKFEEILNRL